MGLSDVYVKTAAKHGKYYYASGYIVSSKKADFEKYDSHKYATN